MPLPEAVIFFSDSTNLGGAELYLLELLKKFKKWGIKNYLITTHKGSLFNSFSEYTEDQIITPLPYPSKPASWTHYFKFKRTASSFIKKTSPRRLLLVGDLYPLWAALLLRENTSSPVYSIWQGQYVFDDDSCVQKWVRYGANRADKLMASSPICQHAKEFDLLQKPICQLNPRSNFERFNPASYNREELRKSLGFSNDEKLALCVGQVSQGKGQPWLARQFLKKQKLYNNWKLIIAGPISKEDQDFWDDIKSQDHDNRLYILGLRKDVPELLSLADLCLFPGTIHESFGLALVEAIIMKKPLLALASGSIPYMLGSEYPGLFSRSAPDNLINAWVNSSPESLLQLKDALPVDRVKEIISPNRWEEDLKNIISIS